MNEQVAAIARRERLDPYSYAPRLLGIGDSNAVLSSVVHDCRKGDGWRSRLLRMTDGGVTFLYASDHVYSEVYGKLPKMARSTGIPPEALRVRFEERYLPVMRFVEVGIDDVVDPQVLAITDPDDVPTGQLAKLIGPCIVFSEDRHLKKPGFAPADWREVAGFAVDLVEGASKQNATGQLMALPGLGMVHLIKFVSRQIGMSPWLLGTMVTAAGILLLREPERRNGVGKYVVPVVEALGRAMADGLRQEQTGLIGLHDVILPVPAEPSVKQQVAIILARQREPLLAREVQAHIVRRFPDDEVPSVAEVRATLTEGPEFIRPERYRWQFGRVSAPWAGEI